MNNSKEKIRLSPSKEKKLRNQEIYLAIATGASKDDVCKKWDLSLTQLNRILRKAREETEQWYKSFPTQMNAHIFRFNCSRVFEEIQRLEIIRNQIKDDPEAEFDMTIKIINTHLNYNKMVVEGPTLARQKEIIEAAEKLLQPQ